MNIKSLTEQLAAIKSQNQSEEKKQYSERIEQDFKDLTKLYTLKELIKDLQDAGKGYKLSYKVNTKNNKLENIVIPSSQLTIIAGASGHGKTTLMYNVAIDVVENYKEAKCHFFSYEEHKSKIFVKAFNCFASEDFAAKNEHAITRFLTHNDISNFTQTTFKNFDDKLSFFINEYLEKQRLSIHYVDYNIERLIDNIKRLHEEKMIDIAFIDYVQLLDLADSAVGHEKLKKICNLLKNLAVELKISIVLGSQFNRTVTNPLRMHATKMSESSDIEKSANLVIANWNTNEKMIYDVSEKTDIEHLNLEKNQMFIEVLKNRDGERGAATFKMKWNCRKMLINDLSANDLDDLDNLIISKNA